MANTVFVNVFRVEHNDYMYIVEDVQKKYPDKFKLVLEEEVKVEEKEVEEVKPKRRGPAKK